MPNSFFDPGNVRPKHEPKVSNKKSGMEPKKDNLKFNQCKHDPLPIPKGLGGSLKSKKQALDVLD